MKSKYAILCGSRCGSTHLCDLLKSTNRAGKPEEFFNKSLNFNHLDNSKGFIDSIVNGTKTENDVFGVKIVGIDQLEEYSNSQLDITHCILLSREDKVSQAISRYKSWKTNVWHLSEKHKTIPKVEYSFEDIKWCYEQIILEYKIFNDILKGTNYFEVTYEDLIENPEQTVFCILEYLNISTNELPELKSKQIKVSGRESLGWKQRFEKEYGNQFKN